jgi:hypothetical protein
MLGGARENKGDREETADGFFLASLFSLRGQTGFQDNVG